LLEFYCCSPQIALGRHLAGQGLASQRVIEGAVL
jgi:hypothetical protein